ncbi:MAG: hypothetical protein KGL04_02070 [Elusimicrobia bacterium]|nr:hypothetical protein [Elusimicrobiota bacterium]
MASDTGSIPHLPPEIRLDFYGVGVRIAGSCPGVLDDLRRDFSWFSAPSQASAPDFSWLLEIDAKKTCRPASASGPPVFKARGFTAYERRGRRLVRYSDGSEASFDFRSGAGRVRAKTPERARELAYLAVLSRVGEALDRRGLHRVHALGLEQGGQAALVLLPSGGGKSSLALEIFRRSPNVRFLSEDSPLVCTHGLVHPFPLRWSLRPDADLSGVPENFIRHFQREGYGPKRLVDAEFFRDRIAQAAPLRRIFIGRRGGRPAQAAPASSWRAFARLLDNLVVGRGLPQMAEYMAGLGPGTFKRLAPLAFSRARTARRLARQSPAYRLDLGPSPAEGAKILLNCLEDDHGPGTGF